MSFLLCSKNWTDYFDIIITGSQKPNFFMAKSPLYEVNLESGLLKNIEVLPVVPAVFSLEETIRSNIVEETLKSTSIKPIPPLGSQRVTNENYPKVFQ